MHYRSSEIKRDNLVLTVEEQLQIGGVWQTVRATVTISTDHLRGQMYRAMANVGGRSIGGAITVSNVTSEE